MKSEVASLCRVREKEELVNRIKSQEFAKAILAQYMQLLYVVNVV